MLWIGPMKRFRRLGIMLMILSLTDAPLPTPDYHETRHSGDEGEVCVHHDHLLKWHRDDAAEQDNAVFHWHWAPFTPNESDADGLADGPDSPADSSESDTSDLCDDSQFITHHPARLTGRIAKVSGRFSLAVSNASKRAPTARPGRASLAHSFGSTFPPRISSACRLQRWVC